jgi:hypothetical protein
LPMEMSCLTSSYFSSIDNAVLLSRRGSPGRLAYLWIL